jgi:hypothetical protein
MKNRVYKIKDKILVRGNENELTKDEVLVKEENGSILLKERVNGQIINVVLNNRSINEIDVNSTSINPDTDADIPTPAVLDLDLIAIEDAKTADAINLSLMGEQSIKFTKCYSDENLVVFSASGKHDESLLAVNTLYCLENKTVLFMATIKNIL